MRGNQRGRAAVRRQQMGNEKNATLPDGRRVAIREAVEPGDDDRLHEFFLGLPASVRNYLRYDVADRDLFDRRMAQLDGSSHWRLIAEVDGSILAEATMDREPFGWTRHVAELRAVVSPAATNLGLRALLLRELVRLARQAGIGRVFTEVLAEQADLIRSLAALGFEREAFHRRYARDLKGRLHDVVVMSNDLEAVWEQLQEMVHETDTRIERKLSGV
jgi:RimJ/RimL family protein N-acetyltransferase